MTPKISDAEWRIMKLLWREAPLTANQMMDVLADKTQWSAQTLKTLLSRLVKKGALRTEKQSREFLYFPEITEDECLKAERQSFLGRVYNGAMKPLLTGFLEDQQLSDQEIADLKRILEKKENKRD